MISAHPYFEGGWGGDGPAPCDRYSEQTMQGWQRQWCRQLATAHNLADRLLAQMPALGYAAADMRDLERNLRGAWLAWFRGNTPRWNQPGVEVSYRLCTERTILVLRPTPCRGVDQAARDADCREVERSFRLHQPLMQGYSLWLRFDPDGRCVALCKYAASRQ